uniref:C2 domain-containing protein n=1 Tax=Gopherus agassizii TaxID=38772 RepID=A0A452IRL8_9SAUR
VLITYIMCKQNIVRVRIIEGRQLQGNNIKPVVKVFIGNHVYRTRIKTGNNPYFNEIFFQNFHETPTQLFDETINIQLSARNTMSFTDRRPCCPSLPGHALNWKWLSLYHPTHLNAGLRGYLKVSLCVLGAGDQAPLDKPAESEDVESSLLKPAAMPVCMATFELRIYRAEDIPQSMCRIAQRIPLHGLVIRAGGWEPGLQGLFLSHFSSLGGDRALCCLLCISRDQAGKRDVLGTTYINLSQVSSMGAEIEGDFSGFLPCFGPTFLTLYGSPREFTRVAYRGRILVELNTSMDRTPLQEIEEIPAEAVARVERYLSRRKYGLCAIFYSATMLPAIKELIQFEVSIGNYGNKFDVTCKPCASTTQYSQAVFDGNHYHYLPWYDTKPMVAITSFWEDASYYMDTLNILHSTRDRLTSNLDALRSVRTAEDPSLGDVWKKLLKELLEDCNMPDVVIWMLCKEKRVAYARVKAHTIMFSKAGPCACGKLCGKTHTLFLKVRDVPESLSRCRFGSSP